MPTWEEQQKIANIKVYWPMSQKYIEIDGLKRFLSDRHIRTILEIGTFKGGTALLFSKMVEPYDGHVYCLDFFRDFPRIYTGEPEEKRITEIVGDSHTKETFEKVKETLGGNKVDFLFIDGDHTLEGATLDFIMYSRLVKNQCWIGFHDIKDTWWNRLNKCVVGPLWQDLRRTYPNFEFVDIRDHTYMGIGVIRWWEIIQWDKLGWDRTKWEKYL